MHTVDASSDPSVSLVELSASNLSQIRALKGDAQTPSPQFGNRTIAFDQPLPECESNAKTDTGLLWPPLLRSLPGSAFSTSLCILLTLPLWLPVFFLIALWIKLASPGPIFFRQERVGYRGNRFMILKFRTMKVNVETAITNVTWIS